MQRWMASSLTVCPRQGPAISCPFVTTLGACLPRIRIVSKTSRDRTQGAAPEAKLVRVLVDLELSEAEEHPAGTG
jgi:hypothetical protein